MLSQSGCGRLYQKGILAFNEERLLSKCAMVA